MSSSNTLPRSSAIFPNLPRTESCIDLKNGNFVTLWSLYFQQMNQALQNNLSPLGFLMPSQPTAYFARPITAASSGTILYDSSTNEFKGNVNGVWKTFTLV